MQFQLPKKSLVIEANPHNVFFPGNRKSLRRNIRRRLVGVTSVCKTDPVLAEMSTFGWSVDSIERGATTHKQAITLRSTKADIGTNFRQ